MSLGGKEPESAEDQRRAGHHRDRRGPSPPHQRAQGAHRLSQVQRGQVRPLRDEVAQGAQGQPGPGDHQHPVKLGPHG